MGSTIYGFCENKGKHEVYTKEQTDKLLADKASTGHTHDDRYYTETEINSKLADYETKGVVLYGSPTGSPTGVTLSESVAQFAYLEVYFKNDNDAGHSCVKIVSPIGKTAILSCLEISATQLFAKVAKIFIDETAISVSSSRQFISRTANGEEDVVSEGEYIYIIKVVGYR